MADYFDPTPLLLTPGTVARAGDINTIVNAIDTAFEAVQTGIQNRVDSYSADTGVADAYVVTLSPAPTAYTAGMELIFKAANLNTGASTINVNGLGLKNIKRLAGGTPLGGDIPAGGVLKMVYDGTNFQIADNGSPTFSLSANILTISS